MGHGPCPERLSQHCSVFAAPENGCARGGRVHPLLDGLVLKDLPDGLTKGCLTAQGPQRGPG